MNSQSDPTTYENKALTQALAWRTRQHRKPGLWDRSTRATQDKINNIIPEAVHKTVTAVMKQMTKAIMTGSGWTAAEPRTEGTLEERELAIYELMKTYRTTASVEGAVAGAGGFLLAAADLPAFMAIKIKLLFEICAVYGFDSRNPEERLFILRIFHLAFSSARQRPAALAALEASSPDLEGEPVQIDWRQFQLEYRDYIDLAKLLQLMPVIGAPVGAVVNWRLTSHLAKTAVQAYRLRWFNEV
ncbi:MULTISPECIES: EcsC family protein [unclassified Brevundimonas]|uniref:EcsC family protein n=1 Tax=unclassified Brevundimonas TaxID=2622653 RepID=UPI0025BABC3F|nr:MULTISPECIES: EcsC family protein [unclassified Brevundimonas]